MSARQAAISDAARAVYAELRAAGIALPTRDNCQQFRRNLIDGSAARVAAMVAAFDGEIEDIAIAGLSCKQVTPRGWSSREGLCILYAFGGGYVSGSTIEDQVITLPLARDTGARIVMVDYRLSPEHPYPLPQQDMQRVYAALLAEYPAARLVVSGESAGGNQALALMQHVRASGLELPCCAALFSPWVDLANQGDSHDINDRRDPTLNNAWVDSAAAMHADDQPLDDPGMSPLFGDMRQLPPCIITTGSYDLLLSQCLRLAQRMHAVGVECDLRVWEGMWHVFEFYPIPEAAQSIAEVAAFIRAHS